MSKPEDVERWKKRAAMHAALRVLVAVVLGGGVITGVSLEFMKDETVDHGEEIEACPADYEGVVRVTDTDVLDDLSETAKTYELHDTETKLPMGRVDIVDKPGELACRATIAYGDPPRTEIVLSPAGIEVLDRSMSSSITGPGSQPLPDGLELIT